jgi:hypothetical protein
MASYLETFIHDHLDWQGCLVTLHLLHYGP